MRPQVNLSGTNLENAKQHNRRVVFEALRQHGRLSRADITRLTRLTSQTISNITSELLEDGYIKALPPEKQGRGQPAVPFEVEPTGAYSVGVVITQHEATAIAVDLVGNVVARCVVGVKRPTPSDAVQVVDHMTNTILQTIGVGQNKLVGLGIAVPGPFGVRGISAVGPTTLPGWEDTSVGKQFELALKIPVFISNDTAAACIAERRYGNAAGLANFASIYIGLGLGAGLFLDGKNYVGTATNAGEIGHIVMEPGGKACYCGNQGCLERYVSLFAAYEALAVENPLLATPEALMKEAAIRPAALEQWLDQSAHYLKRAINILESLLDLDTVFIGGLLPEELMRSLHSRLGDLPLSTTMHVNRLAPRVQISQLGPEAAALGAAALPIFHKFHPDSSLLLKG
jgi:predicted NBD/HSP70 family sugar kinase